VQENLQALAHLHTDLMLECWGETWSNDRDGTDVRQNSYALWRCYLDSDAILVAAYNDEGIAGVGVSVPVTEKNISDLEWIRLLSEANFPTPYAGDVELAMVLVRKEYRGNGVFRRLAEMRMAISEGNANEPFHFWLQTLADDPCVQSIRTYYSGLDFQEVGRLMIKGTKRVFLNRSIVPEKSDV
jgi:hypothetical protein